METLDDMQIIKSKTTKHSAVKIITMIKFSICPKTQIKIKLVKTFICCLNH